jgi:hypothetical protein
MGAECTPEGYSQRQQASSRLASRHRDDLPASGRTRVGKAYSFRLVIPYCGVLMLMFQWVTYHGMHDASSRVQEEPGGETMKCLLPKGGTGLRTGLGVVFAWSISTPAFAGILTSTLPDFDYIGATFPSAPQNVGTFSYSIPTGEIISAATISGTWGNSNVDTSAPNRLFVEGIEVAFCDSSGSTGTGALPCDSNYSIDWSFDFAPVDFVRFDDGLAPMTAIQDAWYAIRLSNLQLSITTASSAVPEPSTLALMVIGLAGVGFAQKRKLVA